MTCDEILELLLEADLNEATSDPQSPIALHFVDCSRCRAIAEILLDGETALASALAPQPRRSADHAVDDILALDDGGRVARRRILGKRGWSFAIPAAAAAAIALMVSRPTPLPPVRTDQSVQADEETVSAVEVPEGHSAAIFRTSDPKITVVWIYQENGS